MKGQFIVYQNEKLAKSGVHDGIQVFVPFDDYPDVIPGDIINISVNSYGLPGGDTHTNAEIKIVKRRYHDTGRWDIYCWTGPISLRGLILTFG